jgi:hypothetical protein
VRKDSFSHRGRVCQLYQVDPSTGEADEDGYEDEYQLEELEVCN